MADAHPSIAIDPESDPGHALRQAAETGERVRVVAGDAAYELDVHLAAEPDADAEAERIARARAAIRRATGAWQGQMDFDAFLEDLYESRRRVDRPEVRFDRD